MTSYVENAVNACFEFDIKEILEKVMVDVLENEKCPYEAQVNLLLTDDEGIREYNREYRNKNEPTDVLSFPMIDYEKEADFSIVENKEADYFEPETGELILGDIIISADRVRKQAAEFGHSQKRELAFLVTHSLLHLCGYDHIEPEDAVVMEKKQEEVLSRLGIKRDC